MPGHLYLIPLPVFTTVDWNFSVCFLSFWADPECVGTWESTDCGFVEKRLARPPHQACQSYTPGRHQTFYHIWRMCFDSMRLLHGPCVSKSRKGRWPTIMPMLHLCSACICIIYMSHIYICIQGVLENLEEGVAPVLFWLPHYYIRGCFLLQPAENEEGENWRQWE